MTFVQYLSASAESLHGEGQLRHYSSLTTLEKHVPAWREAPLPVPACAWSFASWMKSTFQDMIVVTFLQMLDLVHEESKFKLSTLT